MLHQWVRAFFSLFGIRLPLHGVVCVAGLHSIAVDADGHAEVRTRRSLVFLKRPRPGDLRDTYALATGDTTSSVIYMSSDADELLREDSPRGVTVTWLPRDEVTLYGLYEHHGGWRPTAVFDGPALCFEYDCDMRTGEMKFEVSAPTAFEAAVAFRRPTWPRRLTERHIVRTALRHLKSSPQEALFGSEGTYMSLDVRAPQAGSRYLFVAFRASGVAECEQWLRRTSLMGRLERAAARWTQAFNA